MHYAGSIKRHNSSGHVTISCGDCSLWKLVFFDRRLQQHPSIACKKCKGFRSRGDWLDWLEAKDRKDTFAGSAFVTLVCFSEEGLGRIVSAIGRG
jgi:hypothetical protein